LGRFLCQYRGKWFVDKIADKTYLFLRHLNNVNFQPSKNGEHRIIEIISKHKPKCIFDVGANIGEWSQCVSQMNPEATIHSFEIVSSTYQQLLTSIKDNTNIRANNFGLSDKNESITISMADDSSTATSCKIIGMKSHEEYYKQDYECEVRKASDYINSSKIAKIDFVKIDVEGMDLKVIKGFENEIDKVRVIQFEYGIFNIASHDLLTDFCYFLNTRGFIVGKIFPLVVQFFEYQFQFENFHGSNYIAVRKDDMKLIDDLKRFG